MSVAKAFALNFMGTAPVWYKLFIVACLIINPIVAIFISPMLAGWMLVAEFIFTLAMALKCYPLQPGGLITIEACFYGLCDMAHVKDEIAVNLEVILLLMFMVAGIHFVRDLLLFIFTKLLVKVRSHKLLIFIFCFMGAFLAAFLDALTVVAVVIAICMGMYALYHQTICGDAATSRLSDDRFVPKLYQKDLEEFRAFLRGILMQAACGTAIGGVCTLVGQPQNLLVGGVAGWSFGEFALRAAPVSVPIIIFGFATVMKCPKAFIKFS